MSWKEGKRIWKHHQIFITTEKVGTFNIYSINKYLLSIYLLGIILDTWGTGVRKMFGVFKCLVKVEMLVSWKKKTHLHNVIYHSWQGKSVASWLLCELVPSPLLRCYTSQMVTAKCLLLCQDTTGMHYRLNSEFALWFFLETLTSFKCNFLNLALFTEL